MACDDGGIMRESEFIRRVAEAESVIRYTFRLEIPEAEQRLKGDLVACSLDQAYRMTESLFSNYWKNRPFHINDKRKEPFEVKDENYFRMQQYPNCIAWFVKSLAKKIR